MKKSLLALATLALIVSCDKKENQTVETTETVKEENMTPNYKEIATKAQDAFFKEYNADGIKEYFAEGYIQHNPHVPTGIEPVLGFLPALQEAGTTSTTHRMLQDGDFIVMHNSYNNAQAFGGEKMVAFDVWRMEDGKVAEHWDNLAVQTPENPSGHTQVDGDTEIKDLDKTEANKALVKSFVENMLLNHNGEITDYISTEKYIQHNSQVADGLEGFGAAMKYFAENDMVMTYEKVHKILGEGNFVLTMSEGKFGKAPGAHVAFYDLFRLEDGKIVEHWDVIQEIPTEGLANENGKF